MMMLIALATLIMTLNGYVGMPPTHLEVTIRTSETGTICVTIDGPEFHRSCWTKHAANPAIKLRADATTKKLTYTLGAPGEYQVLVETRQGKQAEAKVTVLGE